MFPFDLDGLFPTVIGETTTRHDRALNLNATISYVGQDKYDLLIVNTITNKTYLQRNGKQENVMQENWKIFREGGFQEMP